MVQGKDEDDKGKVYHGEGCDSTGEVSGESQWATFVILEVS